MERIIFRREEDEVTTNLHISAKRPVQGIRKDMTPLISLFNEQEKKHIIRKLFKNDTKRFNTFINDINSKMTWAEAFEEIEKQLISQKIDILSSEVQQLTDRIYSVYFPDDISIST